jgi:hypothetical protein
VASPSAVARGARLELEPDAWTRNCVMGGRATRGSRSPRPGRRSGRSTGGSCVARVHQRASAMRSSARGLISSTFRPGFGLQLLRTVSRLKNSTI